MLAHVHGGIGGVLQELLPFLSALSQPDGLHGPLVDLRKDAAVLEEHGLGKAAFRTDERHIAFHGFLPPSWFQLPRMSSMADSGFCRKRTVVR